MKKIRFFLSLLLALSLCLTPMCALAEAEDAEYNLATVTFDSITINDPTLPLGALPLDIKMTFGSDGISVDTLRAFASLDLGFDGESLISLESAIEDGEVKLHIADVSQDISIPVNQLLEMLLSNLFLGGEPLSEAPVEFMQAFGDLLNEANTLISGEGLTPSDEMPKYYYYSEDDWRSFFVEYPAKMRATPAGEEEIVFEGKTYNARKYTYHIDHLTYAEYEEYRNGLLITNEEYRTSEAATAGLNEALNRMIEIGEAFYTERQADENAAAQNTAEPTADPYEGIFFSEEGTFYLIDEVMGTLETGSHTIHYADGTEYTETLEQISYMTDTQLVTDLITAAPTGTTREASVITIGEDGTITVVMTAEYTEVAEYDQFSFSTTSTFKSTEVITENKTVSDEEEVISFAYTADGVTDSETQTTKTRTEVEYLSDTLANASVSMFTGYAYGGETSESLIDVAFSIERGTMPEGTLLRVSGKPLNPLTASEDEMNSFGNEVSRLIMNIADLLVPPVETPSSVGGALMG